MICPFCETANRDEMEKCYHCNSDLSMLRLVINKARQHYNIALEHAERQRYAEAIHELQDTLELHSDFPSAHVVLGTIYAKLEQYDDARAEWEKALALDPTTNKAYQYLNKLERVSKAMPTLRRLTITVWFLALVVVVSLGALFIQLKPDRGMEDLKEAVRLLTVEKDYAQAGEYLDTLKNHPSILISEAADQWDQLIQERVENDLHEIDLHLTQGNLEMARGVVAALRKKNLNPTYVERLRGKDTALRTATFREWDQKAQEARDRRFPLDELAALAGSIAAAYPDDPDLDRVHTTLEALQATSPDRRLETIKTAYDAEEMTTEQALHAITLMLNEFPDHAAAQMLLEQLLNDRFERLAASFRESIEAGRSDQAEEYLTELRKLSERSEALAQRVYNVLYEGYLAAYGRALDAGDMSVARAMLTELKDVARQDETGRIAGKMLDARFDLLAGAYAKAVESKDRLRMQEVRTALKALAEEDPSGDISARATAHVFRLLEGAYVDALREGADTVVADIRSEVRAMAASDPDGLHVSQLQEAAFTVLNAAFDEATAAEETDRAQALLEELIQLSQLHTNARIAQRIESLTGQYQENLKETETERIRALTLDDVLADADALTLPPVFQGEDRQEMEAILDGVKRAISRQAADWMVALDYRYQILSITPEQAEQTVRLAQLTADFPIGDHFKPKALFYLAAAHYRLEDLEAGDQVLEQLTTEYPRSTYTELAAALRRRSRSN